MEYRGIDYKTKEINRNFKMKVIGVNKGNQVEKLVGVSGLVEEVGDIEVVNSILNRAFNSKENKIVCKLRRGLKVIFYSI